MHPLIRRLLSPAGFVLVGLLFLLPFVTASCGGGSVAVTESFTGIDLATHQRPEIDPLLQSEINAGYRVHAADTPGATDLPRPLPVEGTIVAALGAVLVGALTVLVRQPWRRAVTGVAAAGVAGILLAGGTVHAKQTAYRQIPPDVAPLVGTSASSVPSGFTVYLDYGFWIVIGLLAALFVGNAVDLVLLGRRSRTG